MHISPDGISKICFEKTILSHFSTKMSLFPTVSISSRSAAQIVNFIKKKKIYVKCLYSLVLQKQKWQLFVQRYAISEIVSCSRVISICWSIRLWNVLKSFFFNPFSSSWPLRYEFSNLNKLRHSSTCTYYIPKTLFTISKKKTHVLNL